MPKLIGVCVAVNKLSYDNASSGRLFNRVKIIKKIMAPQTKITIAS